MPHLILFLSRVMSQSHKKDIVKFTCVKTSLGTVSIVASAQNITVPRKRVVAPTAVVVKDHSAAERQANRKLTPYEQVTRFEELTSSEKLQFFVEAGLTPQNLLQLKDLSPASRRSLEKDGPLPDDHYFVNGFDAAKRLMNYKQTIMDAYWVIHGDAYPM